MIEPKTLAAWIDHVLRDRKVDEVLPWRMVEYWVQVELFRSLRSRGLPGYEAVGVHEMPYVTDFAPRTPGKRGVKWADLVAASPELKHGALLELKDLGRAQGRWRFNAASAGMDLAALSAVRWPDTINQLRAPSPMVKDAGRSEEWRQAAGLLETLTSVSGAVVAIVPKELARVEQVVRAVSESYRLSLRHSTKVPDVKFASQDGLGLTIVVGVVAIGVV